MGSVFVASELLQRQVRGRVVVEAPCEIDSSWWFATVVEHNETHESKNVCPHLRLFHCPDGSTAGLVGPGQTAKT